MLKHKEELLDVFITNKKALEKTIESKQLWIVHSVTQKVVAHSIELEVLSIEHKVLVALHGERRSLHWREKAIIH